MMDKDEVVARAVKLFSAVRPSQNANVMAPEAIVPGVGCVFIHQCSSTTLQDAIQDRGWERGPFVPQSRINQCVNELSTAFLIYHFSCGKFMKCVVPLPRGTHELINAMSLARGQEDMFGEFGWYLHWRFWEPVTVMEEVTYKHGPELQPHMARKPVRS